MPVVMCFGDSNTHGTAPIVDLAVYERYGPGVRWPSRVQAALGCDMIEEGLPGRTTMFDDPIMGAHMNGVTGLKIALESHGPLDVLVLMLGTNDSKARFTSTPQAVLGGVASLLDIAQHRLMQERHGGFRILLICPAPVVETGPIRHEFWGGAARSAALSPLYAALAQARGIDYLDAGTVINVSPLDGVHFDQAAHGKLAEAVSAKLKAMI
ncbi:hydrolase [Cypionkella aquatica]|uniref:Hydrolase n=1 Tax=Cypionkella aquatica TaxID=1756042 RepID=A0AA37TT79_9RHOB|nr:SGNH/GDSL hydrolase family protein [Cypionkella aquatica]GLS85388.1 hydrolase [Cypionkella aquatica]